MGSIPGRTYRRLETALAACTTCARRCWVCARKPFKHDADIDSPSMQQSLQKQPRGPRRKQAKVATDHTERSAKPSTTKLNWTMYLSKYRIYPVSAMLGFARVSENTKNLWKKHLKKLAAPDHFERKSKTLSFFFASWVSRIGDGYLKQQQVQLRECQAYG